MHASRSGSRRRAALAVMTALAASLFAAPVASASLGALIQKPGELGCIAAGGLFVIDDCAAGDVLGASDVALSPDGRQAYVTAAGDSGATPSDTGAIAIFDRDPATGELTQKAGPAGCMTEDGSGGDCADGVALAYPGRLTLSPDGHNVYVSSGPSNHSAIAILDRDPVDGELTQQPGPAGCLSDDGFGGLCADARSIAPPGRVAISSDGTSAYVTSFGITSGSVAVFDRNPATGGLTQKAGTQGCVSNDGSGGDCAVGGALTNAISVTTSPDARNVYVISYFNGVAIFDRDPSSGVLTQKSGQAGCLTDSGAGGCADGRAMQLSQSMSVSPDGTSAYLAAGGALVLLDRDPASGALTQKPAAAGCISRDGSGGECAVWHGLRGAVDIVVSPDARSAYTAAYDGVGRNTGIGIFDRQPLTGALTQQAGSAGCVTDDGSDGACEEGLGLYQTMRVAISPDGRNVYGVANGRTGGNEGSLTVFDRDLTEPAMTTTPVVTPVVTPVIQPPAAPPAAPPPAPAKRPQPRCPLDGNVISGTPSGDTRAGTADTDIVFGLGGNDALRGLAGRDCLYGEAGDDRLDGGAGDDLLSGGNGADRLVDGDGRDVFSGGGGDDRIDARDARPAGRRRADSVRCGAGRGDVARVDRADRVAADCERVLLRTVALARGRR